MISRVFALLALAPALALAASAFGQPPPDLQPALEQFSTYTYEQPRKGLHDARLAAFRGADEDDVRRAHEQLLLDFVRSGASVPARREACLWLSDLGTEAGIPVLEELARQQVFADVALVALDALREPPVPKAGLPSHERAQFRAAVLAADHPAEVLTHALSGQDEGLARLAFALVADGVAAQETCAWLEMHGSTLSPARQVVAMNVLAQLDAAEKNTVITRCAREGEGEAKRAAVRHLGSVGSSDDLAWLQGLLLGSDEGLAEAARQALVAMPESVAGPYLLGNLKTEEAGAQQILIEVLSARGNRSATEALLEITGQAGHPNQVAAIRALGRVGDVQTFPVILEAFAAAPAGDPASAWQAAMWDMARRQPDYDQVLDVINAVTTGNPAKQATLAAMAEKLGKLKPTTSLQQAQQVRDPTPRPNRASQVASRDTTNVLLPGSFRDITPDRFEVAAYLDCGPHTKAEAGGITIEALNGKPYRSGKGEDPSLSVAFAEASLDFQISGLDPAAEYIIGFTWWDSTLDGRWQSIHMNGEEVLPPARPIAYERPGGVRDPAHPYRGRPTPARIQFLLPPGQVKDGACNVSILREGPVNVVNSELWIMRRARPRAEKQVLLVSGQDFPGHLWRETGPVVEELITEDPRVEVTICETPYAVGLKHLDAYDVVFLHCKNYESELPSTEAARERLERYVRNGGGLCLSHFACGAFQEWPEFVALSGRVWNGGGHDRRGPFTVEVVDHEHPVTQGLGDFETDDELYWCLEGDPEIHLLCQAFSQVKKANHPQAFVCHPGRGRVFLSTLGHDVRAFEPKEVRRLYRQGTAWAAGLE